MLVFKTTVSRADSQSWTPEFHRRFNHLFIDSGVFWGPSKAGGAVESTLVFVYNNYVTGILPSFFFFIISSVKPVAFRAPFCFHSQLALCSPNFYFDFEISAISISQGKKHYFFLLTYLPTKYLFVFAELLGQAISDKLPDLIKGDFLKVIFDIYSIF